MLRRNIQEWCLIFHALGKLFIRKESSRFELSFFFMAYLSNFSLDQCRETILFLCVKMPRLLGNVWSEGEEFQKTVSLSLSMSRSEPGTHPWIWIGCDMDATFLSPSLFAKMTRMWSEVHNSIPVRRECLALPVSYHFLVMSPV